MKIGIITDIHSNIQALNAVRSEFDKIPMSSNVANCGILNIEKDKIDFEVLSIEYNLREVIQEIEKNENSIL